MVQERAEEIVGVFFEAIKSGDWRAAEALLMRVYGKPQEKLEVTHPQTVEDVGEDDAGGDPATQCEDESRRRLL